MPLPDVATVANRYDNALRATRVPTKGHAVISFETQWLRDLCADRRMPMAAKAIGAAHFARYSGSHNRRTVYASLDALVDAAGCGRSTAQRALTRMVAHGWLVLVQAHTPNSPGVYQLRHPASDAQTTPARVVKMTTRRVAVVDEPSGQNDHPRGIKMTTREVSKRLPSSDVSPSSSDAREISGPNGHPSAAAAKRPDETVAQWRRRVAEQTKADAAAPRLSDEEDELPESIWAG